MSSDVWFALTPGRVLPMESRTAWPCPGQNYRIFNCPAQRVTNSKWHETQRPLTGKECHDAEHPVRIFKVVGWFFPNHSLRNNRIWMKLWLFRKTAEPILILCFGINYTETCDVSEKSMTLPISEVENELPSQDTFIKFNDTTFAKKNMDNNLKTLNE